MIVNILAAAEPQTRTLISIGGLIVLVVYVLFISLLIVLLYRAAVYFGSARKEQKLSRIEMGKLAEEVHQLRQELKEAREKGPPAEKQ